MMEPVVAAPIVGTTSLKNLKDLLGMFALLLSKKGLIDCSGAIEVKLTEEEIEYLNEPYQHQDVSGH